MKTLTVTARVTESCSYNYDCEVEVENPDDEDEVRDAIEAQWTNESDINNFFTSCDEREIEWFVTTPVSKT